MAADGINAGDAVVTFLANTQQLDQAFTKVNQEAVAKLEPTMQYVEGVGLAWVEAGKDAQQAGAEMEVAGIEGEEAAQKIEFSMNEARGTIALVGEETGIRLPRHLRTFVAELPGVGAALEAAFSGVAILILLQILVEAATKLSEFTAELIFNTKNAEENMAAIAALNGVLLGLEKEYERLKEEADKYGKSAMELAKIHQTQVKTSITDLNKELALEEKALKDLDEEMKEHTRTRIGLTQAYAMYKSGQLSFMEALTAVTVGETQRVLKAKELEEAQNKLLTTAAQLKAKNEELKVSNNEVSKAQDDLNKEGAKLREELDRQLEALKKAEAEFQKLGAVVAVTAEVQLPEAVKQLMAIGRAIRDTGGDTSDLTIRLQGQKQALDILYAAYQKGQIGIRTYQQAELSELQTARQLAVARGQDTAALDKQIQALQRSLGVDKQKEVSLVKMTSEEKIFRQALAETGSVAQASATVMAEAMGSAVAAYAMGQASIGQSLAKMVQQELASVSQRATIKAIEQLAEGFGTMFTNPAESASHFTSAAIWGTIGAATAVAGRTLTGAAGGNGPVGSKGNPVNVATSGGGAASPAAPAGPIGGTGIQSFAMGGLITKPTLAMIGDRPGSKGEVAFDLGDEVAKKNIREAMGQGGGQTVIVQGLVSPDNLKKVFKHAGKMVKKGQMVVHATTTGRIVRRSS